MTTVRNNSPFNIPMSTPILLVLLIVGFFFTRFRQITSPDFDPLVFALELVTLIIGLVVGITIHEFSHAWSALLLGDHTAESQGRVSLNPTRHLDPFGTLMVVFAGFGWGRPTPVNPWNLKPNSQIGSAIVSVAGPISNFITAVIFAVPLYLGATQALPQPAASLLGLVLQNIILINIVLGVFNLLPLAPMDGFRFLVGVLPRGAAAAVAKTEPYGPIVLLVLIALPFFLPGVAPLSWILNPVLRFVGGLILPGTF